MNLRCRPHAVFLCLWLFLGGSSDPTRATESDFAPEAATLVRDFCFKCHSDKKTKAHLNLQQMAAKGDFGGDFKTWEKVISMLEQKEMPPEDEAQPTDQQRRTLVGGVRDALEEYIRTTAGDPGRIALRRLTSAEYAYSILDLTGLDLGLERHFVSDAVGGEGFSNVGDVQFVQDSTLEHYLEAAKLVAGYAVIGAGPLSFFGHPGKTGQELAAMDRIQAIYRQHGFRTASGEGGKAFGLEHYPKAIYAAWQFKNRAALGQSQGSLATFAHEGGIDERFVQHLYDTLENPSLAFPGSEIAAIWRRISSLDAADPERAKRECERLCDVLQAWQTSFAENTGDAEVASVLTETSFRPSLTNTFRIRLAWPPGSTTARFQLSVQPASTSATNWSVLWRQPSLRFRRVGEALPAGGRRGRGTPLRELATESTAKTLGFAVGSSGASIGTNDFLTAGAAELSVEFNIPSGTSQAELLMEAQLTELSAEADSVVRCVITHDLNEGATAAASGLFSFVLTNPNGRNVSALKAGVAEFARKFPQISHREAAPADRDPIPRVFNNDYNNAERNEFHATLKYYRDDRFLVEHVLDESTRRELDQAWADLLTSFDYHNIFLRLIAKKHHFQSTNLDVVSLSSERIEKLPDEAQAFVRVLVSQYSEAQNLLREAEAGHIDDAIDFARRAWRRPLSEIEEKRLRSFYVDMRRDLDHPAALRLLLSRILVAPAFLYRIETFPSENQANTNLAAENLPSRVPLSDWELASRLSCFLWGSIPDQELWRAAQAGELRSVENVSLHAKRMLRDAKARRFATEFFGQWFGFYRFDGYRGVDTTRFTEFTENLKGAMYDEAISFFEHIVREDRPVHDILFANYAFLNRDLARHYGIEASSLATNGLRRVDDVNRYGRGGLLRLGAVLTSTSAPLRTSAVKRGDWLLRRVLGKGVLPPPGDAGSIPPDDVLADGKTVRQRLEAHRSDASCVNCHARMDPFGFALEHFDSIGRWRDTYRDGQPIDASGTLSDGTEISEFEGLNEYLLKNERLFNRTLCAKLLGFALGRGELVSDRPLLTEMSASLDKENQFSTLILKVVTSPQFRYRRTTERVPVSTKKVAAVSTEHFK